MLYQRWYNMLLVSWGGGGGAMDLLFKHITSIYSNVVPITDFRA